nr:hypothetical protein [Tanacetum cinerariifolium]
MILLTYNTINTSCSLTSSSIPAPLLLLWVCLNGRACVDVIVHIFVRLDGIDLVRCKSVCKTWFSIISTPLFVTSHLNYTFINNYELRDKRIIMHDACFFSIDNSFLSNEYHIIGSSNGLVCISPKDVQLLVTNPLTREVNYLPTLPDEVLPEKTTCRFISKPCWGFGYDSSMDDYKKLIKTTNDKRALKRKRRHAKNSKRNAKSIKKHLAFGLGRGRPRNTLQGGDPAEPVANRDPRDIEEIERLQQRIQELELQQDERNEETESNSVISSGTMVLTERRILLADVRHLKPAHRIAVTSSVRWAFPDEIIPKTTRPRFSYLCWGFGYDASIDDYKASYPCEAMDVDPLHISNHKYCSSLRIMDYVATPIFVESLVSPHGSLHARRSMVNVAFILSGWILMCQRAMMIILRLLRVRNRMEADMMVFLLFSGCFDGSCSLMM